MFIHNGSIYLDIVVWVSPLLTGSYSMSILSSCTGIMVRARVDPGSPDYRGGYRMVTYSTVQDRVDLP